MELNGVPPPSMDWNSTNLPEAWRQFYEHAELIFKGPLKGKGDDVQITYLLLWIGKKGRDIYKTLPLSEDDRKTFSAIGKAFKEHVQPKSNPVFHRFKFNNEVQGENTMEQFITKLRLLASDCEFANESEMIRDRIVFGVKHQKVRERLINEGSKLTMDKAIEICQNYEYAQEQLKSMSEPCTAAMGVHAVNNPPRRDRPAIRAKPGGARYSSRGASQVQRGSNRKQFGDKTNKTAKYVSELWTKTFRQG